MIIRLNGEDKEIAASTVAGLLAELGIAQGRVAVEVNLDIVRKADYPVHPVKDGDQVEIVNFVGGG